MRFWDTSALLALVVRGEESERIEALLRRDPEIVLWWGTPVECAGGLGAAVRDERLAKDDLAKAKAVLEHLRQRAFEIQALEEVRARALRILALHSLRAGQAMELAAALVWCRERTRGVSFVAVEDNLRQAAALEGFRVLPYEGQIHDESEPEW